MFNCTYFQLTISTELVEEAFGNKEKDKQQSGNHRRIT